MMDHTQLVGIAHVRQIVAHFVLQEPVSQGRLDAARNTVEAMCQQGVEYGLMTAEVVKAIFGPVFERGEAATARLVRPGGQIGQENPNRSLE